jgi:hypothetical protein
VNDTQPRDPSAIGTDSSNSRTDSVASHNAFAVLEARVAMVQTIQRFATALTRAPYYECGHADAWVLVARSNPIEDLLVALGYCAGYADGARLACAWDSLPWRIADTLSVAAKTFAVAMRAAAPTDLGGCVDTYRAELDELLARERLARETSEVRP